MPISRSQCPHLPEVEAKMSHRCLTELDAAVAPAAFYFKALQYGNYLWQQGHAGRAILAVTRALYSDIDSESSMLEKWALPYAALGWIVHMHDSDDFPGNPRISFQHQATRLRGKRQGIRRARAWAVWAIICRVRPSLPAGNDQVFDEPSIEDIYAMLKKQGHPKEADLWQNTMRSCNQPPPPR